MTNEEMLERDLLLYGAAFTLDGKRVCPTRVQFKNTHVENTKENRERLRTLMKKPHARVRGRVVGER